MSMQIEAGPRTATSACSTRSTSRRSTSTRPGSTRAGGRSSPPTTAGCSWGISDLAHRDLLLDRTRRPAWWRRASSVRQLRPDGGEPRSLETSPSSARHKAYLFAFEEATHIIWNPTTMEITGKITPAPELLREGLDLDGSPARDPGQPALPLAVLGGLRDRGLLPRPPAGRSTTPTTIGWSSWSGRPAALRPATSCTRTSRGASTHRHGLVLRGGRPVRTTAGRGAAGGRPRPPATSCAHPRRGHPAHGDGDARARPVHD